MRCLFRLVSTAVLIVLLTAAWFFRDDLARRVRQIVDPAAEMRRTGHPSPEAYHSAAEKVDSLRTTPADSILLSPDEVAALVVTGARTLPDDPLDSVSVELGDRTLRIRAMVNTARLPLRFKELIPGVPAPFEEVIASGPFNPVRDGVAELTLTRVLVRGLPIPDALVGRLVQRATGRATGDRLEVAMPPDVAGFRVRPTGMAIYPRAPR